MLVKTRYSGTLSVTGHCELIHIPECAPGTILAFSQVLGFVNVVAFSEQNVETELEARLERVRHGLGLEGPNA